MPFQGSVSGGGSLTGASPGGYDPRYGGIPQVPNPSATSAAAIAANLGNLNQLYSLFGGVNTFNANQAANQLKLNLPNYEGLIGKRSGVIGEELAGQLPQDVLDLIIQQAAERGIATGSPISPNNNAAYLKALGLTSLGQISKGMSDLSGAIHDTPTAPLANPASMFITPDAIQQAQMAANLYASAPVPRAAAEEARRYGDVSVPRYGGAVSGGGGGFGGLNLAGAGSFYRNPEPQYGTYVANAQGPFYEGDRYDNYEKWLNTTPWGAGTWEPDLFEDFYNASNPADTTSRYDPILDVSINPSSLSGGGDWYPFYNADLGF